MTISQQPILTDKNSKYISDGKGSKMRNHKSRGLALLLAVAMVFQFCIFSSQSAWAGSVDAGVTAEDQVQGTSEDQVQGTSEDQVQDEGQPAEQTPADVEAPAEEPAPGDTGGEPAETPADTETAPEAAPADTESTAPEAAPADVEAPAAAPKEESPIPGGKTFIGRANGVSVLVTAEEGTFEDDVKMVVKKVSTSEEEKALKEAGKVVDGQVYTIRAVDITFVDANGKEVQPAKPVKVDLRSAVEDVNADREVVHIKDNGKAEVMSDVAFGEQKAVFDAEHFSIYAIVEHGEDARAKVIFKGLNDQEIASMYVKKTDKMSVVLYDPGAGTLPDGVYFRGWTTDPDYTPATEALTIEQVRTQVEGQLPPSEDGTEITYYAMLFKDYRITYLDENNISLGQEEVTFRADAKSDEQPYTVNMAYTVQNDTHHFEGWNVKEGSRNIVNYEADKAYQNKETITITGDVTFSVNAPEGHWFIFDENGKGATYTAPQFIHKNATPTPPNENNMIRNGYTFGGWYADKATADQTSGGDEYDFNQTLTDKTTVYARWIPKDKADYTIIIWKQNLDGDGYDFYKAISGNDTVGEAIDDVSSQGSGNNAYARINGTNYNSSYTEDGKQPFKGFHLKEFDQNVTIKTEGNSVLNVYYDRNEHTLQFQVYMQSPYTYTPTTSNSGTQYGLVDGEYVQLTRHGRGNSWDPYYWTYGDSFWSGEGPRYTGTRYTRSGGGSQWTTIKEITALYGQSIGDNFPIVGTNGVTYDQGQRWMPQNSSTYNQVLVYIDTMPDESVTFHLNTATHTTKYINYYVEALPGETGDTVTYKGKTFVLHKNMGANYGFFTEKEDYLEFVGFTKFGYTPNNAWGENGASTVNCYYTRNVYPINFMDGKYVDGDNNPLEESGMGQINLVSDIAYGADVSSNNDYVPDAAHTPKGFVFEGWYIDSACTQPYTFDKMPEGGITVYAKWRQKQYRVFLHVNYPDGATGNINWGSANQAMNFRISEGGHVSEPTGRDLAGYAFDGWYLDPEFTQVFNGEAYAINEDTVTTPYNKAVDMTDTYNVNGQLIDPNYNSDLTGWDDDGDPSTPGKDRFWITKKLDIYAKWHSTLEGASGIVVEYDADGGTSAPIDTHTYVDTAKAPAGAASKAPAGSNKVFGYWEVQKYENGAWVGTGEKVLPGDTFTVLKANAKVEDLPTPAPNGDTKKYTVMLKAVYIDSEQPTLTHISWFKNDGTPAFHTDPEAVINVGVPIQPAPTRTGYTFLGWSRVPTSTSNDYETAGTEAAAWETNNSNYTQNLTESDLYLTYADGAYKIADGTTVTQVAPDENLPYHAMFAVWKPELKIRITGNTDTKEYNGTPQSVTGYTVEYKVGDGEWTTTPPEGVSVNLSAGKAAIASGTDASGSPYLMGLEKDDFEVNPGSYGFDPSTDLEVVDGWLKITPVEVTVKADDATKVYDKNPDNPASYTATVTGLIGSDTISYTVSREAGENVGEYTITPSGETEQGNYTVTYETGTFTITPKEVTVTTGSGSKEYDGTALTNSEASITGLVNGETATVTATGSQTEAGSSKNTYTIDWGTTNKDNYTIAEDLGTLNVTKNNQAVTLTAASDSKTYDGTALTNGTVTPAGLPEGFTVEATASGSATNVGDEGTNVVNDGFIIKDAAGNDKTANFTNVSKVNGKLTINPAQLTVTTGSDSKAYDGKPLTKAEADITGFVNNETATVTATGTITEVGSTPNTYTINWGTTNKDNYTITENLGTLTITESSAEVVLTAPSDAKTYDGTPLTCNGTGEKKVTASGLPEGFTVEATASGSATNVGDEGKNTVDNGWKIYDADGVDKTANFTNVTTVDGKLTINPASVTITTESASKPYDGTALTNPEGSITGLVNNETATVTATGTITEVGNTPNTYTIDWGTTNKDNYTVTENLGTLTITTNGSLVELKAASDSKTYDGTPLTNSGVTATGLPEGFTVEATASGSQTNVGNGVNIVNDGYVIKNAAGEVKTANFTNVNKLPGKLTVNPMKVTIKADDASKTYDGSALTQPTFTATPLAETDEHTFTVTMTADSTITNVGTQPNVIATVDGVAITPGTETAVGNYLVTTENGTLTVNPKAVTITAKDASKTYDGTALTQPEFTISGLEEGDTHQFNVVMTASSTITNVGTEDNVIATVDGVEVTTGTEVTVGNYKVTTVDGTLEIKPQKVTITAEDASKPYDGTALTQPAFKVEGLATADGHTFSVVMTEDSTITNVGEQANVIATVDGTAVPTGVETAVGNYLVTTKNGTLEITPKEVTITAKDASKTYDGTALTQPEFKVEGLAEGDQHEFTVVMTDDSTITNVGEQANVIATVDGEEVSTGVAKVIGNYKVTTVDGKLKIDPQKVTITAKDASKTYDGSALTQPEFKVEGLAEGDQHEFTVVMTDDSTITNVGTEDNVIATVDGVEVTTGTEIAVGNYLVTTADGTLTVNPKKVTITAKDASKTYNGSALTESGFTASDLEEGDDHTFTVVMTEDSTITNVGTQPNVIATVDGVAVKTGEETKVGNYLVTTADGTLTVNPKEVTITANDANKAYDGTPLTEGGFTATALEEGDNHEFTVEMTEDSTITNVGTQPNVIATVDGVAITGEQPVTVGNYLVNTTNGQLTITQDKKALVITSATKSWTYDGQLHTDESYTVTYDGANVEAGEGGKTFMLENGDVITITATAEGVTNVADNASNNNTYSYKITNNGVSTEDNYESVAKNIGTLTINPKAVMITAKDAEKTYNGTALTQPEFEATALEYGDTHTFTVAMTEGSTITNVGTQANVIATVDGVAVTNGTPTAVGNYTVTTVDGTLKVNPKAVTITAKDASKSYDGTPLTQPAFEATPLEEGDSHEFSVAMTATSTITNVGTKPNVIMSVDGVAVDGEQPVTVGNYLVTTEDGTLEITEDQKVLVITSATTSWTYDSKLHKDETYTVTYGGEPVAADESGKVFTLENGDVITITATAAGVTNVSDNAAENNTYTYTIKRGEIDSTGNYASITANVGTLTINPKAVTITANDKSKTYDSKALTESGFEASALEDGDTHTFAVVMTEDSTITNVGTKPNVIATVDGTPVTAGTETAIGNYKVTTVDGTLTINPKAVTITAKDASKPYDGIALTQPAFDATALEEGDSHEFSVTMTDASTITDVGTQANVIATVDGTAVTTGVATAVGNYLVTTADGELEITQTKAKLEITSNDHEWTYDSQLHKDETYTVKFGDETATADETGKVFTLSNGDVVTIMATAAGVTDVADNAANNNTFSYTVKRNGEDTSGNYETITATAGTLKINPKKVTITAEDANKTYDGSALTQPAFKASALETGDSHTFTVVMTDESTITDVGTQPNVIATVDGTAVTTGEETLVGNYLVTTADGTLTVNPKKVTITAKDASQTYNGSALTESGFTASDLEEGDDHTFKVVMTDDSTITNVGTQANVIATVDGVAVKTGEETKVGNYLVTTADGTLTVNPKAVTITANSKDKPYDGTALTEGRFTATALEEGDDHTFTVVMTEDSTITNVGTKANVIATVDGEAVETGVAKLIGNYTLTTANGTLEITQDASELKIESSSKAWTYDSKLHKDETYTVTYKGEEVTADSTGKSFTLGNGDVVTITPTTKGVTNVSDNENNNNTFTYTITNGTTDTKGNYNNIVEVVGTLTINPKAVTITAKDADKVYDSKPLTEDGFTAGDLEEGDTHTFTVEMTKDSTITNVGTQPNVIAKVDGEAVETGVAKLIGNYTVTTVDGTLEITAKEVTITALGNSKTYDSKPLTEDGFTASDLEEGDTHTFEVKMTEDSTITNVGTQPNVIATVDGEAVETGVAKTIGNYKVTTVDGTLTVNPKKVTITADSADKPYDGTALTEDGFKASDLEAGDTHTFTVVMTKGSTITDVGTTPNVIATVDGVQVTTGQETAVGNYLVTTANGELEITEDKTALVITSADNEWTYDSGLHKDETYTVKYGNKDAEAGTDGKTFTLPNGDVVTITATAAGVRNVSDNADENNTYTFTVKRGETDSSGNYETITANTGTLKINPKAVTITAKDADKPYDGKPLTEDGFTASDLEEGDTHTFQVEMTEDSTITDVGTQPNVIATVDGEAVETGVAKLIGNYTVTTADGELEITKDETELEITSATTGWTYDSKLHKDETYTVKYNGEAISADNTGKTFTLPNGDVVTITATAAGVTNVSDNTDENNTYTFTVKRGETDSSGNYKTITANTGTLTINPKEVTITASDNSKTYDSKPLTEDGFTATDLEDGDTHTFEVEMTKDSTITNVGTQANVIATVDGEAVETGVAKVIGNYKVTTADGTLTVNAKAVTITANDANKAYDGKPLTEDGFTATDLEEGDTHTFEVEMTKDSTITNAGTKPNVIATVDGVKIEGEQPVAVGNYLVTTASGTLTITQDEADLVITSATKSWTYDSTNHKDETYTVTYDGEEVTAGADGKTFTLPNGDVLTITPTAEGVTEVADNADNNNTYKYAITHEGADASGNYKNVVPNFGTLTINPKAVTITAKNAEKTYNGSALTQPEFEATALEQGDTHTFTVEMTKDSTITDVGTKANVIATVDGEAVETGVAKVIGNYSVTTVEGTLTVNPKKVTITAEDADKVYDSKPLTEDGFKATDLEEGDTHTFTVAMTEDSTITNVGEKPNVIATVDGVKVKTGEETKVGNYLVTTEDGTLTVNPKKVTITAKDADKPYDGKPLTEDGFTATNLEEGDTHTFDVKMTKESMITDVGTQPNVIATVDGTAVKTGEETAVGNYLVTTADGTLEITQDETPITIDSASTSWTYDSRTHKDETYTVKYGDDTVKAEADGKTFKLPNGDVITITPTSDGVTNVSDNANNNNTFTFTIKRGDTDTSDNYKTVTPTAGTLTINPKAVTITAKNAEKEYDGTALTESGYRATALEATDTHTFEVKMTEESTITNAGTQDNVIATVDGVEVKTGEATAVGNYLITPENGILTITPAELPENPNDPSNTRFEVSQPEDVVYNGLDQELPVTVKDTKTGKELGEDDITIEYSPAKHVGTVTVTITAKEGGNYSGSFTRTYKITPASLTITSASGEKVYDGTPLTKNDPVEDITIVGLQNDETVGVVITGSQTNVGSSANTFDVIWAEEESLGDKSEETPLVRAALLVVGAPAADDDAAADDTEVAATALESDYTLVKKEGTLTVTKASLTVKTGSAKKEYDGKPLTCDEATISGLADGENVTIKATGSQTEVGSSSNTYSIDWGDVDANNYEITVEQLGTLTVTAKAPLPVPDKKTPATRTGDPSNMTIPILGILAALILD